VFEILGSGKILQAQLILLVTNSLTIALLVLLFRRWQLLDDLRPLAFPLALFAVFGTLDALVTTQGTWTNPHREANPMACVFLVWGGWLGYCLNCALWIAWWVLVLAGLTALRRRSEPPTVHVVDGLRLWVAYALGLGHLGGWLSWGHGRWLPDLAEVYRQLHLALHAHCPALLRLSPLGPGLYDGLVYGGLAAIAHLGVRWAVFRVGPIRRDQSKPD
jgi:hypothetical protein